MSSLRKAMEAALAANPDDRGTHMAYADYLQEQGDPRGEFIQLQLALEEEGRTPEERKKLQEQEQALLQEHAGAWLGKLAPLLLGQTGQYNPWHYQFSRGWLDQLLCGFIDIELAKALAREPQARLLRRLALGSFMDQEGQSGQEGKIVATLARSAYLGNVRVLHYGSTDGFAEQDAGVCDYNSRWDLPLAGGDFLDLTEKMPRLEELYLQAEVSSMGSLFKSPHLSCLRVLQIYLADSFPLGRLVKNPALGRLSHLSLRPRACDAGEGEGPLLTLDDTRPLLGSKGLPSLTHLRLQQSDLGDAGCAEIVESGILRRLKFLDLARGSISDDGAMILAGCPDLRNLQVLDLSCNALTAKGIAALNAVLPGFRADNQHEPEDLGHLYEGEWE